MSVPRNPPTGAVTTPEDSAPPPTGEASRDRAREGTTGSSEEPRFDPDLTDAEIRYLSTRRPFCDLQWRTRQSADALTNLIRRHVRLTRFDAGQTVHRRHDYGASMWVVLTGAIRVGGPAVGDGTGGGDVVGPGDMVGEVAATYRTPHDGDAVADVETLAAEIRWQGLRIMRRDERFRGVLDERYRRRWLPTHLRQTPLLQYLDDDDLRAVVAAAGVESHGNVEWQNDYRRRSRLPPREQIASEPIVASEGSAVTHLTIVRSGFGRLTVADGDGRRTVGYVGRGDLFGLAETLRAIHGGRVVPLQRTLSAVGHLDVLTIPVETFVRHVVPRMRRDDLPTDVRAAVPVSDRRGGDGNDAEGSAGRRAGWSETLERWRRRRRERRTNSSARLADGRTVDHTSLLEFVVGRRYINATQAMVIDLDRCVRCDDCVAACADANDGIPRFARVGPSRDGWQFAAACGQCVDPVCLIGCPTAAIRRSATTAMVTIDAAACIGCGICASACPYDHIEMVPRPTDPGSGNRSDGSQPTASATHASKCDGCVGRRGGPACVEACGYDAIRRVDVSDPRAMKGLASRSGRRS